MYSSESESVTLSLVCVQNISKSYERISMKFYGPKRNRLDFGGYPDQCPSPGFLFRFRDFYPRDAMLARVFAIATCPSVCLSVCPSVRPSHAGIVPSRAKAGS